MIRFLDGPAAGVELQLRRAPLILRVVFNSRTKEWDALDQEHDRAKPHEQIFLYRGSSRPTPMLIRCSRPSRGGLYWTAEYRLWPAQPTDLELRDENEFNRWVLHNKEKLLEGATWMSESRP